MGDRLPRVGDKVNIIEKRNYGSGRLTTGVVRRLLSNPNEVHPRGNKVELEDGTVGRTVSFVDEVGGQSSVDPAEREGYAAEARSERRVLSSGRRLGNRGSRGKRSFNRPALRKETPPEKAISPVDLPDEDDLR